MDLDKGFISGLVEILEARSLISRPKPERTSHPAQQSNRHFSTTTKKQSNRREKKDRSNASFACVYQSRKV